MADAGSSNRAAKRLGISQPAVSQQMRDLETGVRATLLQRRGKRTSLTSAGLVFQEHARASLRRIDKSLQELSSEPGEFHGTLRLGVIPYLDVALMPKLLGLFSGKHPGVDLSIVEISSTDIESGLEEGRMDVGLGWITRHFAQPSLRASLRRSVYGGGLRGTPVGETAIGRSFRAASTTLVTAARHLRYAADDRRDLSKLSHPTANYCGDQFDRDTATLARTAQGNRLDAQDFVARRRPPGVEGHPSRRAKAWPRDRSLAAGRFGHK